MDSLEKTAKHLGDQVDRVCQILDREDHRQQQAASEGGGNPGIMDLIEQVRKALHG